MKNANQVRLNPFCGLAIAAHRRYRRDYPPSFCQQPDFRRTTYDPSTGVVTLHTRHRVLAMYQESSNGWLYPYPKPPRGSWRYRYQKAKRRWEEERQWKAAGVVVMQGGQ